MSLLPKIAGPRFNPLKCHLNKQGLQDVEQFLEYVATYLHYENLCTAPAFPVVCEALQHPDAAQLLPSLEKFEAAIDEWQSYKVLSMHPELATLAGGPKDALNRLWTEKRTDLFSFENQDKSHRTCIFCSGRIPQKDTP